MDSSFRLVTGMHDVLPEEARQRHHIEARAREVFEAYGYREIQTPALEYADLFRKGTGEMTDVVEKEMYVFRDQGDEELALRPEGTPPVARLILQHHLLKQTSFLKLYYMMPMFRRERPQRGRYRQHVQIGAEAVGSSHPLVDAEQLAMLAEFLTLAGVAPVTVRINSLGCETTTCRPAYRTALVEYGTRHERALCEHCRRRLTRNPMRLLDCKEDGCRRLMEGAPLLPDQWCRECREHHEAVEHHLDTLHVPFVRDPRLVRGFDYYTRTTFEVVDPTMGAQNALCGGGRYDHLLEMLGGSAVPAVGFGVGLERVLLWLEDHRANGFQGKAAMEVYVAVLGGRAVSAALPLARDLRAEKCTVHINPFPERSLKAQMKYADQLGVRFVVILGENEMARKVVTLRDMRESTQREVPLADVGAAIRS